MARTPDEPRGVAPANPDRPSATFVRDWINMAPLPDASIRIYHALRMFVFEKTAESTVSLTNEEIGALTPQADGKPRSRWSVTRAMKPLEEMGLVVEVETKKISVREAGMVKPEVRTVRTLLINDEPPGGWDAYHGPVNPFTVRGRMAAERKADELARRRKRYAKDADESGEQAGDDGAEQDPESEGADLHLQFDQHEPGAPPAAGDVSAGQSDGANLLSSESKSALDSEQICPVRKEDPGNKPQRTKGGQPPLNPPAPAAADAATGPNDQTAPESVGTTGSYVNLNHQHARARAGAAAVAAVWSNPQITESELATIIAATHDKPLTQPQAFGRAACLLAWDGAGRPGRRHPPPSTADSPAETGPPGPPVAPQSDEQPSKAGKPARRRAAGVRAAPRPRTAAG